MKMNNPDLADVSQREIFEDLLTFLWVKEV
jgi:hypothetical protein